MLLVHKEGAGGGGAAPATMPQRACASTAVAPLHAAGPGVPQRRAARHHHQDRLRAARGGAHLLVRVWAGPGGQAGMHPLLTSMRRNLLLAPPLREGASRRAHGAGSGAHPLEALCHLCSHHTYAAACCSGPHKASWSSLLALHCPACPAHARPAGLKRTRAAPARTGTRPPRPAAARCSC